MKNTNEITFDDMQRLICYGHGALKESCFMLLNIIDNNAAKEWIKKAPVSSAAKTESRLDNVLQIAFSVEGLRRLGLKESLIEDFSDEFIVGMSGDGSRSRRLGDVSTNAPEEWEWGGQAKQVPHVLLLLYAGKNEIESWRKTVENEHFSKAFQLFKHLPTQHLTQEDKENSPIEPFGFRDGISQPKIDWESKQSTDSHDRSQYSNLLAPGEVVLGYPNEYGQYTRRPLLDPDRDSLAGELPNALDEPGLKDFARNGSYLVLRQLGQNVPGFWQFMNKQTGDGANISDDQSAKKREELAAAMVGRKLDGTILVPLDEEKIPGTSSRNNFTFQQDPQGIKCPIGSHIRRTNPRNGDLPAGGSSGFISRLIKLLGFGSTRDDQDFIASTRFHRILRRGRPYGSLLKPDDAIKTPASDEERGLQFICLVANISRQFEFVQNAWSMSSKFAGLQQERDPLLGHREPLLNGEKADQFHRPNAAGPAQKTCHLPQFVTVRGGAYFFMPGLRALKYIAENHVNEGEK